MMNENRWPVATALSVFVSLAFAGIAVAQSNPAEAPNDAARNLMMKASESNIAEIEEGRLAMTNSKNPQVQALGNRLVQDHSKAEVTLEALAGTMNVKLPTKSTIKNMIPVVQEHIQIAQAIPGQYPQRTAQAVEAAHGAPGTVR